MQIFIKKAKKRSKSGVERLKTLVINSLIKDKKRIK